MSDSDVKQLQFEIQESRDRIAKAYELAWQLARDTLPEVRWSVIAGEVSMILLLSGYLLDAVANFATEGKPE